MTAQFVCQRNLVVSSGAVRLKWMFPSPRWPKGFMRTPGSYRAAPNWCLRWIGRVRRPELKCHVWFPLLPATAPSSTTLVSIIWNKKDSNNSFSCKWRDDVDSSISTYASDLLCNGFLTAGVWRNTKSFDKSTKIQIASYQILGSNINTSKSRTSRVVWVDSYQLHPEGYRTFLTI